MRQSSRFRQKPVGWRNDSYRHYLAAKGVSTKNRYFVKPSPTQSALINVDGEKYYTGTNLDVYVLRTMGATPDIIIKRKNGELDVSSGTGFMDDEGRLFIVLHKSAGGLKGVLLGEDGAEERVIAQSSFKGWRTIGPTQMAQQIRKIDTGDMTPAEPEVEDLDPLLQVVPEQIPIGSEVKEARRTVSGDLDRRLKENKEAIAKREAAVLRKRESRVNQVNRMRELTANQERTIEEDDELATLLRGMTQAEAGSALTDLESYPVDTTPRANIDPAMRATFLSADEKERIRKVKLELVDVHKENESLKNQVEDVSMEIKGGFDAVAQRVRENKALIAEADSYSKSNEEQLGQIFKYSQAWQKAWREGSKRVDSRLNVAEMKVNELL